MRPHYEYDQIRYSVHPQVYKPAEDTFLLASILGEKAPMGKVLEIGTGCGLLSFIAARTSLRVVATDINPFAVINARENANVNRLDTKIEIIRCDLASALGKSPVFDHIIFNPPYLPLEAGGRDWQSRAWAGGEMGVEFAERVIDVGRKLLKRRGDFRFLVSGEENLARIRRYIRDKDLSLRVLASTSFFYERLFAVTAGRAT